ncbi:LexA family transcriptional regulator [Mesorhizobium australicum]|nr:helix-turn-helix transcriptional regulator [Mesorhizobium australicum]
MVRKYLDGSMPGLEKLVEIARLTHVTLDWLATGEGPMRPGPAQLVVGYSDGFVPIPRLDVRAAAGAGALSPGFAEDYLGPADIVAFREEWLRQLGVSARFARILICDGDSMYPTIAHGDMMLVDTAIRDVRQDGIYVLVFAGLLKVKRVQMRRDGILLLKSDNPAYDTEEVPLAEQPELIIEGRVRWAGGAI